MSFTNEIRVAIRTDTPAPEELGTPNNPYRALTSDDFALSRNPYPAVTERRANSVIRLGPGVIRTRACKIAATLLVFTHVVFAQTQTFVLPGSAPDDFGDSFATLFQPSHVQQVYSRSEFPLPQGSAILITEIAFRLNYPASPLDRVVPAVELWMGVFPGEMEELPFDQYVPFTNRLKVYERQNLHIAAPAPDSPTGFPIRFVLDKPFFYTLMSGQLVVNVGGSSPGAPISVDASWVDPAMGRHVFVQSDRIYSTRMVMATQFRYSLLNPFITNLSILGNTLRFDIQVSLNINDIELERSANVDGVFSVAEDATIERISPGLLRGILPKPHVNTFYRVRVKPPL